MARLHALVASPMTRYVRMANTGSPKRQSFDQGALPLAASGSSYPKLLLLIIRSYVQMLERQHAQLVAGLQELYRRTQNGDGWKGPHSESVNYNPPLTHKILETLGVLHSSEWENLESIDAGEQSAEGQAQDNNSWIYSATTPPPPQAPFTATSPTQMAFPQSTIMLKRRSNLQTDLPPITQTLTMPLPCMTTAAPVKPEPYSQVFLNSMPAPLDTSMSIESMNIDLDRAGGSMMDWSFGMDDLYANCRGHEQLVNG